MDWMEEKFTQVSGKNAFINNDEVVSYGQLISKVDVWKQSLADKGIQPYSTIAIIADYSPDSCALLIALLSLKIVIVPLTPDTRSKHEQFFQLSGAQYLFDYDQSTGVWRFEKIRSSVRPALISQLIDNDDHGFVLFTSGTSGESKGVVLSAKRLMKRFKRLEPVSGKSYCCMVFLKLDHIGGLNTLFSVLCSGGTAVSVVDRSVKAVCSGIERHKVELLPTTPTFLNMLLLAGANEQYDLSSLKIITYGTEPMPGSTLKAINEVFPSVKLKQTYGLTELGIFSTKSKNNHSDWMLIGGEGVQVKIEEDILFIKTESVMLGYLNAPSPFTEDGWYNTGDRVETKGDYIRVLGRQSEIINVGGEKVYPAEVESVLLQMPGVQEVLVTAKPSPVTGNIVSAGFVLSGNETRSSLYCRMNEFCKDKLEPFKVPKAVYISSSTFVGDRLKKSRSCAVA